VHTHIGYGSPQQDKFTSHGSPLGEEDTRKTKESLGWPTQPSFLVPDEVRNHMRAAGDRGENEETAWKRRFKAYAEAEAALAAEFERSQHAVLPEGWDVDIPEFPADLIGMATRAASGSVLNAIATRLPQLIGGSADLDSSTKTAMKGLGDFNRLPDGDADHQGSDAGGWSRAGRNLHFGVREHAMGSIANGLAAHGGCLPFTATFLVFADYMRPPMRLAAISRLHVIHVFTHDSIAVGEDGPTHEPVEQIASLRAIPHMTVIRPCDANETAVAWRVALEAREAPVTLVFSRQDVPTLDRGQLASAEGLRKGGYVLSDADGGDAEVILIGTGSEVHLILSAAERMRAHGTRVRCVSMPSWELFEAQSRDYRDSVLPPAIRARLAVEAGVSQGWSRYVGDAGDTLGVDRYGASAPGDTVMKMYGFTVEGVCERANALIVAKQ
jgi:transketolase